MTPILEMRSFVCVILMSVQFVVACAAIYNATQSFLYKIRLWKPISAVIIAVISLTMFLVSTHVLSKIYYDNQINKMAEFFWQNAVCSVCRHNGILCDNVCVHNGKASSLQEYRYYRNVN